ncbi:dephospho-CoA kinase [Hugenholtzia roseola]|uniref:dephospho-CoA kinase n=1 Tax=Hugenholtzia roseola TaxID=1002 RepID=UPI00041CFD0A|nr:dephospho-CoA kinase [Hugenholtzia roseola]
MKTKPRQIGITGGIGSGKSYVCQLFAAYQIPIYEADKRAHQVMEEDSDLKAAIISLFGSKSYIDEGKLNRAYLAEVVFNQTSKIKQLENLVHPAVARDYAAWVASQKAAPYVLKEAALLFETGSYLQLDATILVSAPLETRLERVQKRDPHRTREQILAIIAKQMPDAEKEKLATYHLDNSPWADIKAQVAALHQILIASSMA